RVALVLAVVVLSSLQVHIPQHLAASVESMSCAPRELVRRLSERGARHLYVDGGKTIQEFLDAGLLQQLIITRTPFSLAVAFHFLGHCHTISGYGTSRPGSLPMAWCKARMRFSGNAAAQGREPTPDNRHSCVPAASSSA